MLKNEWIRCPVCGSKTRDRLREDTVLKNYPLYCPKCKQDTCIGCGKCVSICPMKNLILRNKKVVSNDRCTMCYRCISLCPQKAITLLGNEVVEQYRIEDYR